jgi:hypothetical protein
MFKYSGGHEIQDAIQRSKLFILSPRCIDKLQTASAFRELLQVRTLDQAGHALVQNYYLYAGRAASRQRICFVAVG